MAKRRLSERQKRHIARIQQKRLSRAQQQQAELADESPRPQTNTGAPQAARIIAHHGGQLIVQSDSGQTLPAHPVAKLPLLAVGDRVWIQHTPPSQQATITALEPRQTELYKHHQHGGQKPLAANVSQMLIVIAPKPAFDEYLLDRYLVAAHHSRIQALILHNKTDLLDPGACERLQQRLAPYRQLGLPQVLISTRSSDNIQQLRRRLQQHTSILVGQSGVGKSSLINALLPDIQARVKAISESSGLGVHTTSHSQLYPLNDAPQDPSAIIDSPGVRAYALWPMDWRDIQAGFHDIAQAASECRFADCQHQQEPHCAVQQAIKQGHISPQRLTNMQRIIASMNANSS